MPELDSYASGLRELPVLQKCLLVAAASVAFIIVRGFLASRRAFVDVPIAGPSGLISSYLSGLQYLSKGRFPVLEGCRKYSGKAFKTAELNRWHVYISGRDLIEEVRKMPDDTLSAAAAVDEHTKAAYTISPAIITNPYHVAVIQRHLTRNLAYLFPLVVEEMKGAFQDNIPIKLGSSDWVPIKALDTMLRIVCRTSNRAFVGDTCSNEDWVTINVKFTMDVFLGAKFISLFPRFLMPFAGKYLTTAGSRRRAGAKILVPVIEKRYKMIAERGRDCEDLPNDYLTWLMDDAQGVEREPEQLTRRILGVNVAAIHSSATAFTKILYHLCAYPEYIVPLREEVAQALKEEGWSKIAMTKCRKLDSFVKEVFRFSPGGVVNLDRLAMKDFTFSDGTFIPKGTVVSTAFTSTFTDTSVYGENADEFDGFRFSKIRLEGGESAKHQTIHVSPEFLTFGLGRHACPGRFFAAHELKAMTSHVLLNYDIKLADNSLKHGHVPPDVWYGTMAMPNSKAEILFRRRQD